IPIVTSTWRLVLRCLYAIDARRLAGFFPVWHFALAEREDSMFTKVNSVGIQGIEGVLIGVEADVGDGLPGFSMVGYLSSEVREAQERVKTALKNSGYRL